MRAVAEKQQAEKAKPDAKVELVRIEGGCAIVRVTEIRGVPTEGYEKALQPGDTLLVGLRLELA